MASGRYGDTEKGRVSNDNPLGLPDYDEGPTTEEEAGQPSQPAQQSTQQATMEPPEDNIPPDDTGAEQDGAVSEETEREQKIKYIREKFDGPEQLRQSISELEQKMGKQPVKNFESEEQAVDYYIQLERQLGQRSGQQQPQQQVDPRQLQQFQQQYNQLMRENYQLRQQMQQRPRNDKGQFTSPNQQQQQAQQQQPQQQEPDDILEDLDIDIDSIDLGDKIDKKQFRKDILSGNYNNKPFKSAVANIAQQVSRQTYNQLLGRLKETQQQVQQTQTNADQQQRQRTRQLEQNYQQQVQRLKQKVGEQNFKQNEQQMVSFLRKYPIYLNPQMFPNGFERAYHSVSSGKQPPRQKQAQPQNHQQIAQKKAGQMPGSSGESSYQRMNNPNQQLSPQEQLLEQFNQAGQGRGRYG